MKLYVTVCKNTVLQNIKRLRAGKPAKPPLRVSRGKRGKPVYRHSIQLQGPVLVRYSAAKPLPWGARAWIEAEILSGYFYTLPGRR